jgi:hypothetical protein
LKLYLDFHALDLGFYRNQLKSLLGIETKMVMGVDSTA